MSEIKSTMDLVMERTRDLSLSRDERDRQRREEFEKLLLGLMTQYDERLLSPENLQKRIDALRSEYGIEDREPVMKALMGRVDPDGDNERLLNLLTRWAPEAGDDLKETLSRYRQQRISLVKEAEGRLKDDLARNHGIRGSALVPNPERDSAFREHLAALQGQTREEIRTLVVGG